MGSLQNNDPFPDRYSLRKSDRIQVILKSKVQNFVKHDFLFASQIAGHHSLYGLCYFDL